MRAVGETALIFVLYMCKLILSLMRKLRYMKMLEISICTEFLKHFT